MTPPQLLTINNLIFIYYYFIIICFNSVIITYFSDKEINEMKMELSESMVQITLYFGLSLLIV